MTRLVKLGDAGSVTWVNPEAIQGLDRSQAFNGGTLIELAGGHSLSIVGMTPDEVAEVIQADHADRVGLCLARFVHGGRRRAYRCSLLGDHVGAHRDNRGSSTGEGGFCWTDAESEPRETEAETEQKSRVERVLSPRQAAELDALANVPTRTLDVLAELVGAGMSTRTLNVLAELVGAGMSVQDAHTGLTHLRDQWGATATKRHAMVSELFGTDAARAALILWHRAVWGGLR